MPVTRIVLLLLVLGGLALFAFSNLSPVLSLVFLGMQTAILPLSAWIGIAIAAGAITSFVLQFLSYLQRGYSTRRIEEPDAAPPQSRSFRRESYANQAATGQTPYTPPPPPPETPKNSATSDWEEKSDEDWDFDEERPTGTPQSDRSNYEVKQEPKTGSQSGSVYSYGYREQSNSGVGKADAVYDANYRVITPPYQKPVEPEEDDDWGFEDDEDFNDESQNQPRRR